MVINGNDVDTIIELNGRNVAQSRSSSGINGPAMDCFRRLWNPPPKMGRTKQQKKAQMYPYGSCCEYGWEPSEGEGVSTHWSCGYLLNVYLICTWYGWIHWVMQTKFQDIKPPQKMCIKKSWSVAHVQIKAGLCYRTRPGLSLYCISQCFFFPIGQIIQVPMITQC